jgi:hypothetical protein
MIAYPLLQHSIKNLDFIAENTDMEMLAYTPAADVDTSLPDPEAEWDTNWETDVFASDVDMGW